MYEIIPEVSQDWEHLIIKIVIPRTQKIRDPRVKGDIVIDDNGEKLYVTLQEETP